MLGFRNFEAIRAVFERLEHGVLGSNYDFQGFSDLEKAVEDDVKWLLSHGAVRKDTAFSGSVYGIETGKATRIVRCCE